MFTVNKEEAIVLHKILLKLRIESKIFTRSKTFGDYKTTLFEVSVGNLGAEYRFIEEIGSNHPTRKEQLEKIKDINEFSESMGALLESIINSFRYFLTRAFQGFLALGASLGVSMSILFQEGFVNPDLKFSAIKMLLGFVLIALALGLWIGIPMLNGIVQTQQKLLALTLTNSQSSGH